MEKEDPRIERLRETRAKAQQGGGMDRIDRQHAKGKFTARERLALLLDKNSFVELEAFTTQQNDPDKSGSLGDGVITGYGTIDNRTVYLYDQDFTVQGGALGEMASTCCSKATGAASTPEGPPTRAASSPSSARTCSSGAATATTTSEPTTR